MKTNTKIYQFKQLIKQIAELQRTIKRHRKDVNFKGERQTIELTTYSDVLKDGKWVYVTDKSKIYLTKYNADSLLTARYGWSTSWNDDKSTVKKIGRVNIFPIGDINFCNTSYMAWVFNEAYGLLRYERKTKKNEHFEQLKKEVETSNSWHYNTIKQIMEYFRDEPDVE